MSSSWFHDKREELTTYGVCTGMYNTDFALRDLQLEGSAGTKCIIDRDQSPVLT